jgi:hypothetical protein
MEQGPIETPIIAVRQEISLLPQNTEVHHHRHNKPSLVPIHNQVNPVYILLLYFRNITPQYAYSSQV